MNVYKLNREKSIAKLSSSNHPMKAGITKIRNMLFVII
jgi:hypothetical protein